MDKFPAGFSGAPTAIVSKLVRTFYVSCFLFIDFVFFSSLSERRKIIWTQNGGSFHGKMIETCKGTQIGGNFQEKIDRHLFKARE